MHIDTDAILPIGTVVTLKRATKKLMIFGIFQAYKGKDSENKELYDYIGVPYPEGNIGQDRQFLFNTKEIEEVNFRGFEDAERETFKERIEQYCKENFEENLEDKFL